MACPVGFCPVVIGGPCPQLRLAGGGYGGPCKWRVSGDCVLSVLRSLGLMISVSISKIYLYLNGQAAIDQQVGAPVPKG